MGRRALPLEDAGAYRYFRDVLPRGLRVVTVETPHLHTAMLAIYVRTGSRHEPAATNGVSHFLEHMFFRGSRRHPDTVAMNAAVEEVGGNLNGVTTRDHGYYYTPIHPRHLGVGISILGDMLSRPLMRGMEIERRVILEEMLDEVDERGRDIDLDNLTKMLLFEGHPLAQKIAGTPSTVRGLARRDLAAHLRRHYVTGNVVVCAAGNLRREAVLTAVESAFRDLPAGPGTEEAPPSAASAGPRYHFVRHDESQTEFRLSFRAVPEHHEDYPALQILRRVLDDGLSSRLPYNVVERKGLAYSIHASMEAYSDVGLFEIDAASAPARAPEVYAEICRTLAGVCSRPIDDDELARAKRRHRILLEFSQDSPGDLVGWFGGTEIFRPPESFAERCRQVDAQTVASVQAAARRYLRQGNVAVVAVGQKAKERDLERAVLRESPLPK